MRTLPPICAGAMIWSDHRWCAPSWTICAGGDGSAMFSLPAADRNLVRRSCS